ncbi:MAG: aminotransferase class I/II-fold pyridoxal phosphate-dependent enzyme [Candidatus Lokiarchaeota archaeon]|nr:aminotransferase class I/II-fold pyridoxal phosphate-dependent enzyme [Candidatus Lokiarchaeota archaeon]
MVKIKTVEHLNSLERYIGVKPLNIIAGELNIPVSNIIKLDGNENPYEPLPEVLSVLNSLKNISHYPDPLSSDLVEAIAKKENIEPNNIIVSSGSDELIELLMKAYASPSDTVLSVSPTFGMISFLSQVNGIKNTAISQRLVKEGSFARYTLDEDRFLKEAKDSKIVFIARPNNPDGKVVSEEFIERLASLPIMVVIDEAYIEFANCQSLAKLISQYENLVVLRTFSKAYGLGGLRVGYGIMPNDIRTVLVSIKQPYNVNIAGQKAAFVAITSPLVEQRIEKMKKTREFFVGQLKAVQDECKNFWIHPSEACYVLLTFDSPEIPKKLYNHFYSKGILVRYYSTPDMSNNLRISIGLQEDMEKVISELKLFLKGGN